ncbi:hypothetical protein QQ045_000485 [Rhodiola kirilowii]
MRVDLYIESRRSSPFLQSKHILEKHASEIFTKSVLKKIQIEIYSASHICGIQMMTDNEEGKIYTIYDTERGDKTFQENAPEVTNNNTSKSDFFKSILEMPQPTAVLVNNPGISKNKGCGKRVRGPSEASSCVVHRVGLNRSSKRSLK